MRGLLSYSFREAVLAGLCIAVLSVAAHAESTQVLNAAPSVDSHTGWLKPRFAALAAELKHHEASDESESGSIDQTTTLDKIENLKEEFIDKRTAEYEKERMQQVVTARAKAGRAALFGGRGWKKSFTTASTSGTLWQVDSHKYRETSGLGDRRHTITALPNGYAMQVAAKEVYQSQLNRGHSWITGELKVTYVRNPLYVRLQCEHDWNEVLKKIGGK